MIYKILGLLAQKSIKTRGKYKNSLKKLVMGPFVRKFWPKLFHRIGSRSARPKPSLNVTGPYTSGRRQLPNSLPLTPSPGGDRLRLATGNEEQVGTLLLFFNF
jgi:hypothetical protein